MAKVKTTLSIDENLMRIIRVRAAREGRTQSAVLEETLKEGLFGAIERMRASANLDEEEALRLASEVVHEVRAEMAAERERMA